MTRAVDAGHAPAGDRVHECPQEGCDWWAYSRLARDFHLLREHHDATDLAPATEGRT